MNLGFFAHSFTKSSGWSQLCSAGKFVLVLSCFPSLLPINSNFLSVANWLLHRVIFYMVFNATSFPDIVLLTILMSATCNSVNWVLHTFHIHINNKGKSYVFPFGHRAIWLQSIKNKMWLFQSFPHSFVYSFTTLSICYMLGIFKIFKIFKGI